MATLLQEGFDGWTLTSDHTAQAVARSFPYYWRGEIVAAAPGRTGNRLKQFWTDSSSRMPILGTGGAVSPTSYSTLSGGCALQTTVGQYGASIRITDVNGSLMLISILAGAWTISYNPTGTANDIDASGLLSASYTENYVEFEWSPSAFSLYINNALAYTVAWTGVAVNLINLAALNDANGMFVDDLYLQDTVPRRGMHRIVLLSKGTATENTGTYTGAGTNITGTNSFDGDTTYYTLANAAGQQLMFPITATPLPATVDTVHAVTLTAQSRKTDAGTYNANFQVTRSATDYNVGAMPNAMSYAGVAVNLTTDPSTSAAWTKAGVEAMEFGFKGA